MTTPTPDRAAVERRVHAAIFGKPVIGNTVRGLIVEAMLSAALEADGWGWVAADWASWDFEHRETWKTVEVKQSAARQPWSDHYTHAAKPRFDIAERTGYWYEAEGEAGLQWHKQQCRPADIYIFAWHDGAGGDADQREPMEWRFYVRATTTLPKTKTIGLPALQSGDAPVGIDQVAAELRKVAASFTLGRQRS